MIMFPVDLILVKVSPAALHKGQRSTAPTLDNPLSPIFQFSPCKDTQPLTRSVGDLIKDFVAVADSKSFV